MPLVIFLCLFAVPALDVFATLRLASALNVPAWLLFLPGIAAGLWLLRRESRVLRDRLGPALIELTWPRLVVASARRLFAGVLFVLPGLVSDLIGLALLFAPLRPSPAVRVVGTADAHPDRVIDGHYRRVD
ncbi:MAG: FxsA family protein [Casimicrobiaceae bacterium]|nr:FxsA family protein [Casimicrobiaceae bacterium]